MSIDWVKRAQGLNLEVMDVVDGRRHQSTGSRLEKRSPRDGQILYEFGSGGQDTVERAVGSAARAACDGRWGGMSVERRKEILLRLAHKLETHREELALLESLDVGKPVQQALGFDIPASVATLRFYAEAVDKSYGKVYTSNPSNLSYELSRPVGVVAGVIGWNFPLLLAASKVGPALAAGNTLVLKPSELTPLSAGRLAELALEAGVPEGVFNVVHGQAQVGQALALHRDVHLLTFTGSTATGRKILTAAGESNMKRLILECGGKAPNIVFEDCPDLKAAATAIAARALYNQGEVCTASSRLLVQKTIKEELLGYLLPEIACWRPQDPLRPETRFGAMVSEQHKERVLRHVAAGKSAGFPVLHEGCDPPPFANGAYVSTIVFDQVGPEHPIASEEIFGPVLIVMPFDDEADAIRLANSTIYGLSAVVWTRDLPRAHRVACGIDAGWICVNATGLPSGGPGIGVLCVGGHKQSGIGAEGGLEGLEHYTRKTAVQYFV